MKHVYLFSLLSILVFWNLPIAAQAQPSVKLQNREILLKEFHANDLSSFFNGSTSKQKLVYIQFKKSKSTAPINGIIKESYLGNDIYLCSFLEGIHLSEFQNDIEAWAEVLKEDKISVHLYDEIENPEEKIAVLIQYSKQSNPEYFDDLIESTHSFKEFQQPWLKSRILELQIFPKDLHYWAGNENILFLQAKYKPEPVNAVAVGYTNARIAQMPLSLNGYNLLGQGMTAGVGDDDNAHHVDINDRLKSFNPILGSDHATHVSGTVGGAGIVDERFRGFAPKATIITDFFSQIIANAPTYYENFNMLAANHSYAVNIKNCGFYGTYDANSAILDQQAFDLPHLLHCFAAGNEGRSTCGLYPKTYATVVGAYSSAKNVLTVGAIGLAHDIIPDFTSKGPVKDGRIKPEIGAMGYMLPSAIRGNSYKKNSGTSMATPNVTGAATLLHQRYQQLNNDTADNALIKLVLMNGADDILQPGPDYDYGFGLMNVGRSLAMLDSNYYHSGTIEEGKQQVFTFEIPENTSVAKVMLYWNDPAANPMSAKALVNDLDITVKDPNGTVHLPLILNPSANKVTDVAQPGKDRINNVEQVTLNSPSPGRYSIMIEGYQIPEGEQEYYVAYSFIPKGISFRYPMGAEALQSGDSTYIYWQASDDNKTFKLSFSKDSGRTWEVTENAISPKKRAYIWNVPSDINSDKCLLKIERGNEVATTLPFIVSKRLSLGLTADSIQCPGSAHFSWRAITGVSQYYIFQKKGDEMSIIDSTTQTEYTVLGLSENQLYWFAVAPAINSKPGMRSTAKSYQPNSGDCSRIESNGDLRLTKIISPQTGRNKTSSSLSANHPISIEIHNADKQDANQYKISWQLNNGNWEEQAFSTVLSSGDRRAFTMQNTLNLNDTGHYQLKLAVTNQALSDPIKSNDTLQLNFRHIPNEAMDIDSTFEDDFESYSDLTVTGKNMMGFGNSNHWDFETNKNTGRIRTFVNSGITIEGNRSISMDNTMAVPDSIAADSSSINYFTGVFNLSNYNPNIDEVRTSFDYFMSGVPKFDTGNMVWIRGNENLSWIPLYRYDIDIMKMGSIYHSGSLSLSDYLSENGQSFSSSTQIRFGQTDTSQIGSNYLGNGLTMDNFSLYTVFNDVDLLSIDTIKNYNCALSDRVTISTTLRNTVRNTVYNIPVTYQLDSLTPVTEMIDSIPAKTTIAFHFDTKADISDLGLHSLSVWIAAPGDSYAINDSILNFEIHNQPVIDSFPYYQDFESNDGYFYSEGLNNSWAYGTPNSRIKHAASGDKIWKTNLEGDYNSYEHSYLYSPCFDISTLENPTLSFSLISDIENNPTDTTVYDHAYMEYSIDGIHWEKLDDKEDNYNWYNHETERAWTRQGQLWWRVVTVSLPKTNGNLSFRFVLKTDPGANFEGLGIDDIHIYDLQNPIYTGDSLPELYTQNVPKNSTRIYSINTEFMAKIVNPGESAHEISVQRYNHEHFANFDSTQYFLPQSFLFQSETDLTDSMEFNIYIQGDAMKKVREDRECPSCSPIYEIYRMGITQYKDKNKGKENGDLLDNESGEWNYIPWNQIRYIPYDKGYIAQIKLKELSEIWFNSGGPEQNAALNKRLFHFSAEHHGERAALLKWSSQTDASTHHYTVQYLDTGGRFQSIIEIDAEKQNGHEYQFIDTPNLLETFVIYRILYQDTLGNNYSSIYRKVDWTTGEKGKVWVYPNPVSNGNLNIGWFKGNYEPLQWQFYDNTGKFINSGTTTANPVSGIEALPISRWGLMPGMYFLKIYSKDFVWTFKVVYRP